MKQIDYQMRVKYSDNSSAWNEDNSAVVSDSITNYQHAQKTVDNYNKNPNQKKKMILVMVRNLPKKYIKPILS